MAEPVRDGRRMQNQQAFGESDEAGLFCSPPPGGGKKKTFQRLIGSRQLAGEQQL